MTLHSKLSGLRAATAFSVCLLGTPAALAQAMPPPDGPDHDGPPFGQMHERDGEPGPFGTPPFLRGLGLTDAQNDRVFTILHSQAPKRRALEMAERKADESLREVAQTPELDQAAASAAAQALGQAIADQELLRLQTRAQLKAVLTPQQRAQLDAPRGKGRNVERARKKARQEGASQ
ncbi:periplasmic heavy metal sensor [Massilia aurea]|uniref:Spy/CpxP family protein refolding chaperone n=1 Tax=Massilia aurea TaxID=373040 RepID=UPI003462B80A